MGIDTSHETEGVSVDDLPERLMSEGGAAAHFATGDGLTPKVPILHLGAMGPLHRLDIYDDVR
jgi:hypothetical protein